MFVRTWLLHAPAAPVREKRTLQLWACLNLHSTGSVCWCVQVVHVLESNCTHAPLYRHQDKLYVGCSLYHSLLQQITCCRRVSFYLSSRVVQQQSEQVLFLRSAASAHSLFSSTCCQLESKCVTGGSSKHFSFKWLWLSSSVLCTVCSLAAQFTLWPMKGS